MVDLHNYLLFILASVVLVIAPGPDMAYLLGHTAARGRSAGYLAALGINLGAYVHLLAAMLGLSAIIATSATLFTLVKIAGACYLVWLGINALFRRNGSFQVNSKEQCTPLKARTIFWQGFLCDVLNPKVVLFYFTFLPQFISTGNGSYFLQILQLGVTLNMIAIGINLIMVYWFSLATARFRRKQWFLQWLNRLMGMVFIALGLRLARERL